VVRYIRRIHGAAQDAKAPDAVRMTNSALQDIDSGEPLHRATANLAAKGRR
jgi:hypothetical protein